MTDYYISPKDIISDFLRNRLTDPRKRCEFKFAQTFSPDGSTTEFELDTPHNVGSVSCITGVDIDGTSKTKWTDYFWDSRNEKLIFFAAPTGTTMTVEFKHGTENWIYSDKPDTKLKANSFPRMNVWVVSSPGIQLGNYEAPVEGTLHFQVDIWTKSKADNQIFNVVTRSGVTRKLTGEELAEWLAFQITKAFEDNMSDLHPIFYHYRLVNGPRDLPFNEEYQSHHKVAEFLLSGIKIGRIVYT